jgi:hypothetical protein
MKFFHLNHKQFSLFLLNRIYSVKLPLLALLFMFLRMDRDAKATQRHKTSFFCTKMSYRYIIMVQATYNRQIIYLG